MKTNSGYRAITVHVMPNKKVIWQVTAMGGVTENGNLTTFIPKGSESLPRFYPEPVEYEVYDRDNVRWAVVKKAATHQLLVWETTLEVDFLGNSGGDEVNGIAIKALEPLPLMDIKIFFPEAVMLFEETLEPAMSWKPKVRADIKDFKGIGLAAMCRRIYQPKKPNYLYAIGWHMI